MVIAINTDYKHSRATTKIQLRCHLLSVLSRRRDLQKPNLIEVLSALLRGEAQIVGGVLELAYYRAAGDGQAFPTRERHRVLD